MFVFNKPYKKNSEARNKNKQNSKMGQMERPRTKQHENEQKRKFTQKENSRTKQIGKKHLFDKK